MTTMLAPRAADRPLDAATRPPSRRLPTQLDGADDARLVAEQAEALVVELQAPGAAGRVLAERAALMACRMRRLAERDFVVAAISAAATGRAFDRERADQQHAAVQSLDAADRAATDPGPSLRRLEGSPEGMDHLLAAWADLRRLALADDAAAVARARRWLALPDGAADLGRDALVNRIAAEEDRLRRQRETTGVALTATIAAERAERLILASGEATPETLAARRSEAAAERGFFRALRAIRDLRRDQLAVAPAAPPVPAPTAPPRVAPAPPVSEPLGSFRAGALPPPVPPPGPFRAEDLADVSPAMRKSFGLPEPEDVDPNYRRNRPDPRTLATKRR